MRGARYEIDFSVPQGFVGLVVRKDQLELRVESFLCEEIECDGRDRREVGIRNKVRHCNARYLHR